MKKTISRNKKKRYTDTAVYMVEVEVRMPITYYASKNELFYHPTHKHIEKQKQEIKNLFKSNGCDNCKVTFDGLGVPF
jgi:CMP-N-acetylneuraminic acid synthetase